MPVLIRDNNKWSNALREHRLFCIPGMFKGVLIRHGLYCVCVCVYTFFNLCPPASCCSDWVFEVWRRGCVPKRRPVSEQNHCRRRRASRLSKILLTESQHEQQQCRSVSRGLFLFFTDKCGEYGRTENEHKSHVPGSLIWPLTFWAQHCPAPAPPAGSIEPPLSKSGRTHLSAETDKTDSGLKLNPSHIKINKEFLLYSEGFLTLW